MYSIEADSKITRIVNIFYKTRAWKNEEETVLCKMARKFVFVGLLTTLLLSVFYGAIRKDDNRESIFLANVGIIGVVLQVKCIYLLWNKDEICRFLRDIAVHSFVEINEYSQVKRKLSNFVKFADAFILTTYLGFLCVTFASLPIFSIQKMLPLNLDLPWNWRSNELSYWLSYALIVSGELICLIAVLLAPIMWYLMLNCAIKYQCLGNKFRRMGAVNTTKIVNEWEIAEIQKKVVQQKLFLKELVDSINTHRHIKETIDKLKAFFGSLFLAQIITSGICICSSIYVLAFNDRGDLFQIGVYAATTIFCFFDIFMVMYLGNEIMLSSDRLTYCLFESNWVEQSLSAKNYMIIFTEMLKQPHELVVGKLYPLNLATFTSISMSIESLSQAEYC